MARLMIIPGDNDALRALQGELGGEADVQVFDSANDALWEIRHTPPEVVIADLNLPGMSGMDLAEIIPNFGVATRVVLWSRTVDGEAARQAESAGVYMFLNGPRATDEVRQAVVEALRAPPAEAPIVEEPVVEAPAAAPPPPAPKPAPTQTRAPEPAPRPAPVETPRPTRAEPTAEPPPPRRPAQRRREGLTIFTADNLTPLRSRVSALSQDIGSQCILLTDRAGMVLTEVGETRGIPTMILLPLLSTAFSTAGQISQVLREQDSSALYMQEGSHYDLYCFDILQNFMLVIIFDRGVLASKIGTVWVYAKRAIRDIQEILG